MSFGRLLQDAATAIVTLSLTVVNVMLGRESFSGCRKMIVIEDLPVEILARIFMFLPAKDIATVAEVCRTFNEASRIEVVWMYRCRKDYNFPVSPDSGLCYRDIYTNVLHQYAFLIGLWQPQIASYGGLLHVHFDKKRLVGTELHPPCDPNITHPLRKKPLFSIGLNSHGKVKVLCIAGNHTSHPAEISKLSKGQFSFKCCSSELHRHPDGRSQGLMEWLREESSTSLGCQPPPHCQELLLLKFLMLQKYNYSYRFCPVKLPKQQFGVPIQPGLFKGTYGAHGLEIVLLDYEEENTKVKALKISGDPNVPAGQLTFQVDLNYPIVLREDEQMTIQHLDLLKAVRMPERQDKIASLAQPFCVPVDCFERSRDVPRICKARYHGVGQIAGHDYTNPSFSRGHWIVFTEDLFGFLWLDLLSLSMYHRVKEWLE